MSVAVLDVVTLYAEQVCSGDVVACRYQRLACERHLRDLERSDIWFDTQAADKAIRFSGFLKHYKGMWAGRHFEPEAWQAFIKGSVFGWKRADGRRRFRYVYIEVPRKNGKTYQAADVALQCLTVDHEQGAEVYCTATKKDQAKLVFTDCREIAKRTKVLARRIKRFHSSLTVPKTSSVLLPLGKDSNTHDGFNPHVGIVDEFHAWKDWSLFNVVKDGMGSRVQPLMYIITTAGDNIDGPCYETHEYVVEILEGTRVDDEYFGIIFTLDQDDDWRDPEVWRKANPNLGVSKFDDYLVSEVTRAKENPRWANTVKNKQFNIWTTEAQVWLDWERWNRCPQDIDLNRLRGQPCHIGLDLSTILDLTAAIQVFPPGPYPEHTVLCNFYLPEENLADREKKDRVPYRQWVKDGWLNVTPGEIIDYEFIYADIKRIADTFTLLDVGYDPWNATQVATQLDAAGVKLFQMRQGFQTLSGPSKFLEALVMRGELRHGAHPILSWMARNAVVIQDTNDNIRPDKKAAKKRIDGIVGLIMALGRTMAGDNKDSIYNSRGFIQDD